MTVFSLLSFKEKKQTLRFKTFTCCHRQREVGFDLQYKRIEKKPIHCLESNAKSVFKAKVPQSDPCVL